jgi:ABC-type antimicrobial peptide transport system permease subunit
MNTKKFFKDIFTDEFGRDFDLTSVASVIGFTIGMLMYVISQLVWTAAWLPNFNLVQYAVGFTALVGAIAACQRLKPAGIAPVKKDPTP